MTRPVSFVRLAAFAGLLVASLWLLSGTDGVEAAHVGCASHFVCKGDSFIEVRVGLLPWFGCFRTVDTWDGTAASCTDTPAAIGYATDRVWELDAGASISLFYVRTVGIGASPPDTITLQVRYDSTATVVRTYVNNAAEPCLESSCSVAYTFHSTSDGTVSGTPRAGTYRLYMAAVKGGVPSYSVNTDQNLDNAQCAGVGSECRTAGGALRGNIKVADCIRSAYPSGTFFAYGASTDESVSLTATGTTRFADTNLETVRTKTERPVLTVVETGATAEMTLGSITQSYVVDLTYDATLTSYNCLLEIVGNAALTGIKWTQAATTGHGSGVTVVSPSLFRVTAVFDADPRVILHSVAGATFATADNDVTSNFELYNRGETRTVSFRVMNARSEGVTRTLTIEERETTVGTVCATTTDTGPEYNLAGTISTTLCNAAQNLVGTGRDIRISATDQALLSDPGQYFVSSLYLVNSHPQNTPTLDTMNEDTFYIIGSDLLFHWCFVQTVRGDGTPVDTAGSQVTQSLIDPFGVTQESESNHQTGADGWSTVSFDPVPIPPAGVWSLRCDVAHSNNVGQNDQAVDFASAFTANLVPRFWTNTTLHANIEYKIVIRAEVDDTPSTPDIIPRVNITRVDTTGIAPVFSTIVDNAPAPNVVNWMMTIEGTTYQYNWTPPDNGTYNIRVRVNLEGSGIRGQQSVEVTPQTMTGTLVLTDVSIPQLDSFFWLAVIIVAFVGARSGGAGFAIGVLLFLISIFVGMVAFTTNFMDLVVLGIGLAGMFYSLGTDRQQEAKG